MREIRPTLWFDKNAEEAAEFYISIFPNSSINGIIKSPSENPSTRKGEVVVVEFTLNGRPFSGINGGPMFQFNESVSFDIECDDQREVDFYWGKLCGNGGKESMCGWCKDRFGVSWQVTPKRLREMILSPNRDAAERAMNSMLEMAKIDIEELERAFSGEIS